MAERQATREAGPSRAAKTVLRGLAAILVVPALASYALRASLMGRDRALEGSTQALALLPGLTGQYLRRAFLGRVLDHFDPTAVVEFGTIFSKAGARIHERVYIGPRCHLGLVEIGRDALIAAGVHIPSGGRIHGEERLDVPIRDQEGTARRVTIGAGCWIGSAAVVMADVDADTIVGAGSVVTKPLPARVVAAGVPARVIRPRGENPSTEDTIQV
jgi:acetyltransferase-like isoleucine patch superfamily enzyme